MGRFNKWKQHLKRLAEARQAHRDKDESGREEEDEVIVFDGETTVDVDVDELGEDEVEQAQGRLEELWVQLGSKWPARYVGNSERSNRRRRQK